MDLKLLGQDFFVQTVLLQTHFMDLVKNAAHFFLHFQAFKLNIFSVEKILKEYFLSFYV